MAEAQQQPRPQPTHQNHQQPDPEPRMTHDDRKKPPKEERGYGLYEPGYRRQTLGKVVIVLLFLVAVTVLVLWLVYRPQQPKFRVVGAEVQQLNATYFPAATVTAVVHLTVITRNPNRRVVILYDQLSAFVAYRGQAITPPADLPPLRHETKSTVALSPVLGGGGAVVAAPPDLVNQLRAGDAGGYDGEVAGLRLVIAGRMRYKAGGPTFKSGWRGVRVRCDLMVPRLRVGFVGQLPLLQSPPCTVDE